MATVTGVEETQARLAEQLYQLRHIVLEELMRYAPAVEQYMKTNHPWRNQTGEAERKLRALVDEQGEHLILAALHGVSYGPELELGREGRYAILFRSIREWWPRIAESIRARWQATLARG